MSAPLQNQNPLRKAGLYLTAALILVMATGCGSESASVPTVEPTRISAPIPTATAAVPTSSSGDRPAERAKAPNFSLPSAGGNQVALPGLLKDHQAVVLIFYRGFF